MKSAPISNLDLILNNFLKCHLDPSKPVLLGLSGGADSMCLLRLLLNYKSENQLYLHVAHIDHGWRAESSEEALFLKAYAESLGLPIHLKTLSPQQIQGNLEAGCRDERLKFFHEICQETGCQAVFLAHHAGDQAETVLKKICEAGSLLSVSMMQFSSSHQEMPLWRPLLSIPKSSIVSWLEKQGITYFDDSSNYDTRYLRARMRTKILPFLSEHFGKNVSPALMRLGKETEELRSYLYDKIHPYLQKIEQGPWGLHADLTTCPLVHLVEVKHLIRCFSAQAACTLSHEIVDCSAQHFIEGAANKRFIVGAQELIIDRKHLFIREKLPIQALGQIYPLKAGSQQIGPWEVIYSLERSHLNETTWKELWKGEGRLFLPHSEEYTVGLAPANASFEQGGLVGKWWSDRKIPSFLRAQIPVIWKKDRVVGEWLTGKKTEQSGLNQEAMVLIRWNAPCLNTFKE